MRILITGGTGFLGRPLAAALAARGYDVAAVGRDAPIAVDGTDVIVNLAGENIADGRWTSGRKEALRQSRIAMTRRLVAGVRSAAHKPATFINGSAIGYYGDTGDQEIDESYPPGSDFLATLCVDWEAEAHAASALGCRVAIVRTGIVLAVDGGALKKLLPPFKLFAGGPIASGRQYMSWIHRDDWIGMMAWMIESPEVSGPMNGTAPEPVTNEEFSKTLASSLGRPSWLRVPRIGLRVLLGEMADVALVAGQRVLPRRALELGFRFKYERLQDALAACL